MTENELFPNQGNSLRRRAVEKAARMIETQEALSPEETRQALHELRVHQIELEMQNEELRLAQMELESTRARYLDLYDLAPVGYVTLSEAGKFLEANLMAAAMLGVERNALLKKWMSQFIFSEDQDDYYLHRKKVVETGELQAWEMRLMRTDGSTFWVHLQAMAAYNGECLFTMNDITERKLAETEIQDAREYAENIVETVREPLLVLNPELKILTANHSFYDTFKVTPEETIGNFIYDLGNRQWDIPKLRVLFEEILPHDTVFNGYEVEHDFL